MLAGAGLLLALAGAVSGWVLSSGQNQEDRWIRVESSPAGALVFVEGESGVGKTRLLTHFAQELRVRGITAVFGQCAEGSPPYLPFLQALGRGALADLSRGSLIRSILLIHTDGRLIASYRSASPGAATFDEDVLSGMLTAIREAISHSLRPGAMGDLRELRAGAYRLAMEQGHEVYIAAVLPGPPPPGLRGELRRLLEEVEAEFLPVLREWDGRLTPEIQSLGDRLRELAEKPPDRTEALTDREHLLTWTVQAITEEARNNPYVVLLDDVNWMDTASLELLHRLAREATGLRLLLVGSYRPEDLIDSGTPGETHPLTALLRRMSRERLYTIIKLRTLTADETATIVRALFPGHRFGPPFLTLLARETEGNPLHLVEALADLVGQGILVPAGLADDGQTLWVNRDIEDIEVPRTIRDIILRRVERLPPSARDVLQVMAVAGLEWDFDTALQAAEVGEDDLIRAIELLVRGRIIREDPGSDRYRFEHEVFQEVVYKSLSSATVRMLHTRVGMALERLRAADIDPVLFELAHHFARTRDDERALQYAMLAGERALRAYAPAEAVKHFQTVLDRLQSTPQAGAELVRAKLAELHLYIGVSLENLGRWAEAGVHYQRALGLAEGVGDQRLMLRSLLNRASLELTRAEWAKALSFAEHALLLATAAHHESWLADANRKMGVVAWRQGRYPDAERFLNEALAFHDRSRNLGEAGAIKTDLGNIAAARGDRPVARQLFEEARELLERYGTLSECCRVYNNLAVLAMEEARYEVARAMYDRTVKTARRIGNLRLQGFGLTGLAEAAIAEGKNTEAAAPLEDAMAIGGRTGDRLLEGIVHVVRGRLSARHDEWDRAGDEYREAGRIFRTNGHQWDQALLYLDWGKELLRGERRTEAKERLDEARRQFDEIGAPQRVKEVDRLLRGLQDGTAVAREETGTPGPGAL